MKTIKVPEPINLTGGEEVPLYTFKRFVTEAIDGHELFGKGIANIRKAQAIMDVVEAMGETLVLEDDHFACLKDAVNTIKWKPKFARMTLPFFEAFETAGK